LWLSNQGLVEVNSATGVVSKKRSSSTVPPSLQRVIQAQIDQLPQGLVVVLRYASVLGKQFSSAMLVQMLPARVAASLAVLEEQLRMLQFLHILMPMPKAVFSVGDSWWQVRPMEHKLSSASW
jgi:predicted ATPase